MTPTEKGGNNENGRVVYLEGKERISEICLQELHVHLLWAQDGLIKVYGYTMFSAIFH